jgi:hypothetical protein
MQHDSPPSTAIFLRVEPPTCPDPAKGPSSSTSFYCIKAPCPSPIVSEQACASPPRRRTPHTSWPPFLLVQWPEEAGDDAKGTRPPGGALSVLVILTMANRPCNLGIRPLRRTLQHIHLYLISILPGAIFGVSPERRRLGQWG